MYGFSRDEKDKRDSDKESSHDNSEHGVLVEEWRAEQVMFRRDIIGEFFGWEWPHSYYNIAQKT